MGLSARQKGYLAVRGGAGLVFVGAAALGPTGPATGFVCLAAGLVGMLTCVGTNAGGPGEQAGARHEQRRVARFRAPQGDWPPYDPTRVTDSAASEVARLTPPGDR